MTCKFKYIRPNSLFECLDILAERGSESSILAGGTDLMISLRNEERNPKFVIDISRLPETRLLEQNGATVKVGPTLTYSELMNHGLIAQYFPALISAMSCVGSLQIRNVGTLGGNIANSSPAADSFPPMAIYDAEIMIQRSNSVRIEKLQKLIVGSYTNTLEPDELITSIILKPLDSHCKQTYRRIGRRRSLSVARVNAAVSGKLNDDGLLDDCRISVGSVAPTPLRIRKVEDALKGEKPELKIFREAGEMVAAQIIELVGARHSTEYKKPAIAGLVLECLEDVFIDRGK